MNTKLLAVCLAILLLLVLTPLDSDEDDEKEEEQVPEFTVTVEERGMSGENPFNITWFEPGEYTCLEYDEENDTLYMGAPEGIFVKDLDSEQYRVISYWEGLDNVEIEALHLDSQNQRLFVVTMLKGELYIVNTTTLSVETRITIDTSNPILERGRIGEMLYLERDDCLYLGYSCGLARLNLTTMDLEFWDYRHMSDYWVSYDYGTPSQDVASFMVSDFTILDLVYSRSQESILIGTQNGYSIFNLANESFEDHNVSHLFDDYDFVRDMAWDEETGTLALVSDYWLMVFRDGVWEEFNLSSDFGIDFNWRGYSNSMATRYSFGSDLNIRDHLYTVDFVTRDRLLIVGRHDVVDIKTLLFSLPERKILSVSVFPSKEWVQFFPRDTATRKSTGEVFLALGDQEPGQGRWIMKYPGALLSQEELASHRMKDPLLLTEQGWLLYGGSNSGRYGSHGEPLKLRSFDHQTRKMENISLTGNMLRSENSGTWDISLFSEELIFSGGPDLRIIKNRNFAAGFGEGENILHFEVPNPPFYEIFDDRIYYLSSGGTTESPGELKCFDPETLVDRIVINSSTMNKLDPYSVSGEKIDNLFIMLDNETVLFRRFASEENETTGETRYMINFLEYNFIDNQGIDHTANPPFTIRVNDTTTPAFRLDRKQERIYFSLGEVRDDGVYYLDLRTGNLTTLTYDLVPRQIASFNESDYLLMGDLGIATNSSVLGNLDNVTLLNESSAPKHWMNYGLNLDWVQLLQEEETLLGLRHYGSGSYSAQGLFVFEWEPNTTTSYDMRHGLPIANTLGPNWDDLAPGLFYSRERGLVEIMCRFWYATILLENLDQNNTRAEFGESRSFFQKEEEEDGDPELHSTLSFKVALVLSFLALLWFVEPLRCGLLSLILPQYTRLKKDQVVSQDTRLAIMDEVQKNPGITYNVLMRTLELKNGILAYHLQVLHREGLLRSRNNGMYKHFFMKGEDIPGQLVVLSETQVRVLNYLRQEMKGLSPEDIGTGLGMPYSSVNYSLKKLLKTGQVKWKPGVGKIRLDFVPEEDVAI